jgi:hypothetical protein
MSGVYKYKYSKYKTKYMELKTKMNMIDALKSINVVAEKSFEFVTVELMPKEKLAIKSLIIDDNVNNTIFDYFGTVDSKYFPIMVEQFISSLNKNNSDQSHKITKILLEKIIKNFLEACSIDSLWFTIRIMHPDNYYEIPRWHTDGLYYDVTEYSKQNKYQIKLAGVLFGQPTLFKKNNIEMRNMYYDTYAEVNKNYDRKFFDKNKEMENRKIIAEKLKNYETVTPEENQIAIFVVGNKNKSAVHSEPNITMTRFFFSIVPGTSDNIKELAQRFEGTFMK